MYITISAHLRKAALNNWLKISRIHSIYYGWWIVFASMLVLAVGAGCYWLGFGVFFLPLASEFATSRTRLSFAVSIAQMEGGLLGPIDGYLVDRFGPRRMMFIGVGLMGLGFLWMSQVQSLFMFYVVYLALISFGMSTGIRVPALVAPTNWFIKKRGIALGLATSGVGLGGILVPIIGWLVITVEWRTTAAILGILILVVGLPLAGVMRHRPEHYGLLPDGVTASESSKKKIDEISVPIVDSRVAEAEFSMREAFRTPVFWFLGIVFGLRQLIIGAVGLHQVPFVVDIGISPQIAATVLGMTAITSIVGRLGFGWMGDRIPTRYVMALSIGCAALGVLILAYVTEWWHLIFFVLIYGIGWGGGATTMSVVRADYFGRRAFGTISGLMDAVQMFGLVLGPVFAGWVYDTYESYYLAFMLFAAAGAIAAIMMVFVRPPTKP
jgi:MFS family permease